MLEESKHKLWQVSGTGEETMKQPVATESMQLNIFLHSRQSSGKTNW